jgi:hypothetical protein
MDDFRNDVGFTFSNVFGIDGSPSITPGRDFTTNTQEEARIRVCILPQGHEGAHQEEDSEWGRHRWVCGKPHHSTRPCDKHGRPMHSEMVHHNDTPSCRNGLGALCNSDCLTCNGVVRCYQLFEA